ncbi:MAG: threonylcarbamoyl-AMP synthase [Bacteroidales bacterium]|nr:threonylcarbamoyl-AMP synthase [Bacteroidales bacterium]
MFLKIYPDNPSLRQIKIVVECLSDGGVIIFPTDTIYGLGCDIYKPKAVERIALIKGIKKQSANFSFICHDLSQLSDFAKPISKTVYKLMRKCLPGPFTFILEANNNVPKLFQSKKKTVGIRVPDNNIPRQIIEYLGHPIMSTSIHDDDEIVEYSTDPELIYEKYMNTVDIVIDGGFGGNEASTIISCDTDSFEIIRQGKGIIN